MKKSVISLAIGLSLLSTSASAVDFFTQSARTQGSGGAGVTYAHWSAASNYNPALLGTAVGSDEDFFVVLNFNQRFQDAKKEGKSKDAFDDFESTSTEFENLGDLDLLEGDINNIQRTIDLSNELIGKIGNVDGAGLESTTTGNLGFGMAFEKYAVSFNINSILKVGGTANIEESDLDLLRRYTDLGQVLLDDVRPLFDEKNRLEAEFNARVAELEALRNSGSATQEDIEEAERLAQEAEAIFQEAADLADQAKLTQTTIQNDFGDIFDQDSQTFVFNENSLDSNARAVAIGWLEAGTTIATKWKLESGRSISVGTTLKAVHLEFYDYQAVASDFDFDSNDGDKYRSNEQFFTADFGAILTLDEMEKWRVGASVKNIIGAEVETNPHFMKEDQEKLIYKVEPQIRVGTSYNAGWIRLAADVDLTESKGPTYEDGTQFFKGTQYVSLGAVVNAFDFLELRGGYRHNLASDKDVAADAKKSDGIITLGAGMYVGPVQLDFALELPSDIADVEDAEDLSGIGLGLQAMITW